MRLLTVAVFTAVLSIAPVSGFSAETSHGLAMHGDLKYPAGFKNFEYTNPAAPKGGTVRLNAVGTFDSFNSFIVKGNGAAGLGFIYDLSLIHISEPTRPY